MGRYTNQLQTNKQNMRIGFVLQNQPRMNTHKNKQACPPAVAYIGFVLQNCPAAVKRI
jgi:hypothetical protein